MQVHFCRRCGTPVTPQNATAYVCENNHHLFYVGPPAMGVFLVNEHHEVLLVTRKEEPGKGKLDVPGGFCDANESIEETTARELREELRIEPHQYGNLTFICSGVNDYPFEGEVIKPVDFFFWTRVSADLQVQPGDDALSADWYKIAEVVPDDIAFKTVRQAFSELKTRLK